LNLRVVVAARLGYAEVYRTLIVEDEMLVRMGLKNSINWEKFDMVVVGDAADGQTAWNIYNQENPDIVITDIRMPVMNGIELITKIREHDRITKILILTCVEEFDIAREAMSLEVSDYILKLNMTEKDIESVLQKLKNELDQNHDRQNYKYVTDAEKGVVKEQILKAFLFYEQISVEQFTSYVKTNKLCLKPEHLVLCIMEIDHFEEVNAKFKTKEGKLIRISVISLLKELLDGAKIGEAFRDTDKRYIIIFSLTSPLDQKDSYAEIRSITHNIIDIMNIYLGISVTLGMSSIKDGFCCLADLYNEATSTLDLKYFLGSGSLYSFHMALNIKAICDKIVTIRELTSLKKLLSDQELIEYIDMVNRFIADFSADKAKVNNFFCQLIHWITYNLYSVYALVFTNIVTTYSHNIESSETLDEAIALFIKFVEDIEEYIARENEYSREVLSALQYIHTNYENNISLDQVAGHVNLSSSYFSNVFKKETQVNFIEYINKLRVEKSKKLLIGTQLKTYEIAEKVGFTESTYFSKVFKKMTGISPIEYRKNKIGVTLGETTDDEEN
jgi:two-component system response regulator YesN